MKTSVLIKIAVFLVIALVDALWVYVGWRKDCKSYGKENLAMPLFERIKVHVAFIDGPVAFGLLLRQ